MKDFDELYNEFFNWKKNNSKEDNTPNSMEEELKKIIESLTNFSKVSPEELNDGVYELGEPSEIEEIVKDGLQFKKITWDTPKGKYIKIVVSDVDPEEIEEEKSLQEQLNDAVESEDFELAIKLRDQINHVPAKKTRKNKK